MTGAEVVGVAEAEPDAAPEPERSLAGVATSRVAEPPAFDASITVAFCGTPAVVVVVPVASGAVVGDVVGAGTLFEATVADGDTSRMTWGGSLGVEPPGATKTRMASSAPTAARPPSMPLRCEGAGRLARRVSELFVDRKIGGPRRRGARSGLGQFVVHRQSRSSGTGLTRLINPLSGKLSRTGNLSVGRAGPGALRTRPGAPARTPVDRAGAQ